MSEIWKDIECYEGCYQISNLGNVRSLDRLIVKSDGRTARYRGQNIAQTIDTVGYYTVMLSLNSEKKRFYVHRLIAKYFIENSKGYSEVDHIDGDRLNNSIDNLRWVTHEENMNNPIAIKRFSMANKGKVMSDANKAKLSIANKGRINTRRKCVEQLDKKTGCVIREFESTLAVQKQLGFFQTAISMCCIGKSKSAYGYKWRYKN